MVGFTFASSHFEPMTTDLTEELALYGSTLPKWRIWIARRLFNARLRGDFYDQLGILIDAGESLDTALASLWNVTTRQGTRMSVFRLLLNPLQAAIPVWLHDMLGNGVSPAESLRPWLPHAEGQVFYARMKSGLNGKVLFKLARLARMQAEWAKKARKGATPIIGSALMILTIFYLSSIYYFPGIMRAIPKMRLSGQALLAKNLSDFMLANGPYVLAVAAMIPVLVLLSLPRLTGKFRVFLDTTLWPWTAYREFTGTTWMTSMAGLLDAGDDPTTAMEHMLENESAYMEERLRAIIARDDLPLGDAMAATGMEWPDDVTISHVTIAMRSAEPGEVLEGIAERRLVMMSEKMDAITEFSNYVVMVIVALFAIWVTIVTNQVSTLSTHIR